MVLLTDVTETSLLTFGLLTVVDVPTPETFTLSMDSLGSGSLDPEPEEEPQPDRAIIAANTNMIPFFIPNSYATKLKESGVCGAGHCIRPSE